MLPNAMHDTTRVAPVSGSAPDVSPDAIVLEVGASRYVPVDAAARLFGVPPETILARVRSGALNAAHVVRIEGSVLLVDLAETTAAPAWPSSSAGTARPDGVIEPLPPSRTDPISTSAVTVAPAPDVRAVMVMEREQGLVTIPKPGKLALPDPWRGAARDYLILLAGLLLITVAVFVIQG